MPANASILSTIAAGLATLLLALAGLLALGVALLSGLFTMKAPQGQNAMGLIVPMGMLAIASVATLLAVAIALGLGRFAGVAGSTIGDWLLVGGVSLGVVLALNGAFALWISDHRLVMSGHSAELGAIGPVLANFGGLFAPGILLGLVVAALWGWVDLRQPGGGIRAVAWILSVAAVQGYLSLGYVGAREFARSSQNARSAAAERAAREADVERRRKQTPAERTAEYIANFDESGPAWHLCMSLFHERDSAARELLLDRIGRCQELESQLTSTMASEYASLRGGALDYLAAREAPGPSLAESAVCSLDLLTVDIRQGRGQKTKRLDAEFDREIVRSATAIDRLLAAARPEEQAAATAALASRVANLREALDQVPEGPARDRSLAAIADLEARWR